MCKKQGIFFNLSLWDDFVSNLLYPAILGSLIYEFTNFNLKEYIKYIFLLITAIFYIIDYFYLHYAFIYYINKNNEKIRSCHMIRLDILDTFFFAVIIFLINKSMYVFILVPIIFIFLVEEYYIKDPVNKKCGIISIVSWVSILILLSFFYYLTLINCCNCCCNLYLLIIYGLIVFIYATKANSFYKEEKSNLKND